MEDGKFFESGIEYSLCYMVCYIPRHAGMISPVLPPRAAVSAPYGGMSGGESRGENDVLLCGCSKGRAWQMCAVRPRVREVPNSIVRPASIVSSTLEEKS